MNLFVRVDDRLLHGQVLCSWVPYKNIDTLLVASDSVSKDAFQSAVMSSCGGDELAVIVDDLSDAVRDLSSDKLKDSNVMVVVTTLQDAKKLYDDGVDFKEINIGNLCPHVNDDEEARAISKFVLLSEDDESLLKSFINLGVEIDIRPLPDSEKVEYKS